MGARFAELVGRAMIDPDFVVELQRTPDAILAQYDLSEDERAIVTQALARLAAAPPHHHPHDELKNVLLRRVAT